LNVLPPQAEAFFGANRAVRQNGRHVPQQERVTRFDRNLTALGCSYTLERPLVHRQRIATQILGGVKICRLFRCGEHTIAMSFAGDRPYFGQCSFHLPPFDRQCENSAQNLELAIHCRDFHASVSTVAGVSGDFFGRDRVEGVVRDRGIFQQARRPVLVIGKCLRLRGERRSAIGQEVGGYELPDGRSGLAVTNTDFAAGEGSFVRGFDLLGDPLVGPLGGLPERFSFPREPVPPDAAPFVDAHRYRPALPSCRCCVTRFIRSPCKTVSAVIRPGCPEVPCSRNRRFREQAAAFCTYLESHAQRIYSCLSTPQMRAAQELAEKIKTGKAGAKEFFTLRDVYLKGWSGLDTPDLARVAAQVLTDAGWIRETPGEASPSGGRPSARYQVNPKVRG
jgi:hypothetical protein